jgi:hypothetical protein
VELTAPPYGGLVFGIQSILPATLASQVLRTPQNGGVPPSRRGGSLTARRVSRLDACLSAVVRAGQTIRQTRRSRRTCRDHSQAKGEGSDLSEVSHWNKFVHGPARGREEQTRPARGRPVRCSTLKRLACTIGHTDARGQPQADYGVTATRACCRDGSDGRDGRPTGKRPQRCGA